MHRIVLVSGVLAALCTLPRTGVAQDPAFPPRTELPSGDTLTLSLADAQRLALERNPAFLAERQEAEIARGGLRQARVYNFNPELAFEAPGATTGIGMGEYEASLTQEIAWAGQRGLRIRAARLGLDRAESGVRNAARQTLAEVSDAYYTALTAQRRLAVTQEVAGLNQRLLDATRIQLREGEISVLEANLAEIEVGRARARVLTAEREATSARLELQRLTGIGPDQVVRVDEKVPDVPPLSTLDADSLVALALVRRPDLAARSRAVEQSRALTSLARREAIPNLRIGVLVEREAIGATPGLAGPLETTAYESPRIGLAVSLPVPLWNRNQGLIAERQGLAEQATLARQATELEVRTQVADALRAYRTATEEIRIFAEDVLEPARQNQDLLGTAYRAGKIDLATLLLLRNQLLDAEFGYWDAWLAERRALVELQAATATLGSDILSSDTLESSNDR